MSAFTDVHIVFQLGATNVVADALSPWPIYQSEARRRSTTGSTTAATVATGDIGKHKHINSIPPATAHPDKPASTVLFGLRPHARHQGLSVSTTHSRGPTLMRISTQQLISRPGQQPYCIQAVNRRCISSVTKHEKQHYNLSPISAWHPKVPKRTHRIPCSSRMTGGSKCKNACCAFSYKSFRKLLFFSFHGFDSVFSLCTMACLPQGIWSLPRPITKSHAGFIGRVSTRIPRSTWKPGHIVPHPSHYARSRVDFSNPSASHLANGPTFYCTSALGFPGAKGATTPYSQS